LGGEPTIHPDFEDVVSEIHRLNLGVTIFTNGSRPDKISAVADKIHAITINGHFAHRAADLGDPKRIFANLPVGPSDDIIELLTTIHNAGIRSVVLAFTTPVGGTKAEVFTPEDQNAMRRLHQAALAFCQDHEIFLGYDCSFPLCVDERVAQTRCSSVPVMDVSGHMTICGGEYSYDKGRRHIDTFTSLTELHEYTHGLLSGLRTYPSQFEICNQCPDFNHKCHGMCLAFRDRSTPQRASV